MSKKILLADDSVTIQKVVKLTFDSEDYEVMAVTNGEEALRTASEFNPDIILADISMPGKSGYQICEAVKEDPQLKDTPVVLLAGTFEPLDSEEASRVKADGHIVKPFESKELVKMVNGFVGGQSVNSGGEPERVTMGESSRAPVDFSGGGWGEGDVISAPKANEEEAGEDLPDVPDLEVFEGRGTLGEAIPAEEGETEQEGLKYEDEGTKNVAVPDMATPAGETEGEAAFNVEGFEVGRFETNPFKETSEEVEEGIGGAIPESGDEWKVEEDLIAAPEENAGQEEARSEEASTGRTENEDIQSWLAAEGPGKEAVEEVPAEAEAPEEPAPEEMEERVEAVEEEVPAVEEAETVAAPVSEEIEEDVVMQEEAAPESPVAGPEEEEKEEGAVTAEGCVTLPEERLEEIVRKVAKEVVEDIARTAVPEIAREMIAEEIGRFKETLTKPKQ